MPPPNNLPGELSSFVGRHDELSQLNRLAARARLLTLAGPGGIGKTRLGLRLATERVAEYPHGAWVVELASLADPALVPSRVADVVAPGESDDTTPIARLIRTIGELRLLV